MGCCGEQAARLLSHVGIQEALARRGRAVFKRLEMTEGSPRTAQQPAKHRVLKRLGSRIRELRHERGLSQEALADHARIFAAHQNWTTSALEESPRLKTRFAIAGQYAGVVGCGLSYVKVCEEGRLRDDDLHTGRAAESDNSNCLVGFPSLSAL